MKKLLSVLLLFISFAANAVPFVPGQVLTAAELNTAFGLLQSQNASNSAPQLPILGTLWLNTTAQPYALNEYDGSQWITIAYLNTNLHTWATPLNTLPLGTSVNNPGTGDLEAVLPVQTVALQPSYTFSTSDFFKKTRRSNGGSAMNDTLPPSTATGLANGTLINIVNNDTTATDTVSAGAGTTVPGGSSFIIQPGRDVWLTYNAPLTMWTSIGNTLSSVLFTGTAPTASQLFGGSAVPGSSLAVSMGSCIALSGGILSDTCGGTVTSIGLSLPTIFTVTGSPVSGSGTITATLANQTANTFFAAPNGSNGTPVFRTIAAPDITAVTTLTYDNNTTAPASTAFAQAAIAASESTVPLNLGSTGGGTYSFDGSGTGLQVVFNTSGGAISSLLTIANGGSGFTIGDMVKISGNSSGNNDAILWVTGTTGGVITSTGQLQILYGGTGFTGTGAGGNGGGYNSFLLYSLTITGTLTSNATFILSHGTYITESSHGIFNNNTTGSFTTTLYQGNGAHSTTGAGVLIPQGTANNAGVLVEQDGVTGVWQEAPAMNGSALNLASLGATTPGTGAFTTLSATGHVQMTGLATTGTIAGSHCQDASGNVLYISGANCFSGGAGTFNYIAKTTTYTASASDSILADTSGGGWTLTLPASPVEFNQVCLSDAAGTFGTQGDALTIAGNGSNIMGLSANMTVTTPYASFCLMFYTTTPGWRIK